MAWVYCTPMQAAAGARSATSAPAYPAPRRAAAYTPRRALEAGAALVFESLHIPNYNTLSSN